jgi:mRNA interferase MazF
MNINQGEVWLVEFFPNIGSEMTKRRPAIVISHDEIGKLPLKTIVPITDYKKNYDFYPWMIKLQNNDENALTKLSAIDCFQVKNFSNNRFIKLLGKINKQELKKVHEIVAKTLNPLYTLG